MKYSKRYICLTIILLLVVALKFNRNGSEQVETFRGAQMEPKVWNPLIAESVNENPLSLVVDNRIYSNEDYDIYMNRKLDIMIPVSLVRDSFNCSAGLYDKEKLVVEKHEESADFSLEDKQLTKKNDNYYVSASKLSKSLSYDYSWDIQKNIASAADISGATSIYPSKYDLREKGRATTVKNQGSLGTCWASASVSALETALLPEESVQFSVDHMTLKNSFAQAQNDGGEYTMGMAYLTAWQGPVYEADDPYGDGKSPDGLKPVKHVQEIQVIEGKDFEKIKEAVFKYGGVQTSIYSALRSSQSQSEFYNSSTFAENLTSGVETVMAVNDFTPIEVKDLPAAVTEAIAKNFAESTVKEAAVEAAEDGSKTYQVVLTDKEGTESTVFFNEKGEILK